MNPVEEPADLTPLQRKYLCDLQEFCRKPPSLAVLWMKALRIHLVMLIVIGFACLGAVFYDRIEIACMFGGMAFGMVLRDWGSIRRGVLLWPATAAIIDREKIAMLIEQPPDDPEQW